MQKAIRVIGLALLYVLAFAIVEAFGRFHPYAWTYGAVIGAVAAAWPYFKLCQRYPMPGIAMLCAVLLLLLNFAIGQGHELLALGCVVLGFIAEGLRKLFGNYRGRTGVIASYVVMSIIPFTKTCVLWINYDIVQQMIIPNIQDIYYASTGGRLVTLSMLITMVVITLVLAFISMWILTRNWHPHEQYDIFRARR